ncbi:MAG TPA: GNAT family protein [Rectinemataceae bacterium]|nr:GNAT family protein [Rectinemataceae bacterium]
MNVDRFLEGKAVSLTAIRDEDIALFIRIMNREDSRVLARSRRDVMNEGNSKEMVEDLQKHQEGFIVRRNSDDAAIGYGLLLDRDEYNREASLAITIGDRENRGKGFGQETIRLLLKHAFINLNLESVYLGVFEYNKAAIHVYEKAGFKLVGRRRHAHIVGNRVYDELVMDMVSDEYFSLYGDAEMDAYGI